MISSQISKLAHEHALQLESQGIFLIPGHATPLQELVAFSSPSGEMMADVEILSAQSSNPEHDASMDSYAQFISDTVAKHVDFARNVAAPAIEALQANAEAAILSVKIDPLAGYKFNEVDIPAVLQEPEFVRLVQRYQTGTSDRPKGGFLYPNYSNEQIIAATLFGQAELDGAIQAFFASLPEGQLQTIWQSVFQDKIITTATAPIKTFEALLADYFQDGRSCLAIFLISYGLSREIMDDVGLNLQAATALFDLYCQVSAGAVKHMVELDAADIQTASMVRRYDATNKVVSVNGSLFRKWTNEGGRPEVLLGLLVQGSSLMRTDLIDAEAEKAVKAWETFARFRQAEQDSAYDLAARAALTVAFKDGMEAGVVSEEEKTALAQPGARQMALTIFTKLLKAATAAELRDNYAEVFWRAACQARFHYTGVYGLLSDIDYEVRVRGADVEDAATVATMNYICNFIPEQTIKTA